ncbi:MAG: DUF309 domain-containing protein [Aquificaceae bacterium]
MREIDLLKEAQRLWNSGDFYSAHEVLEDIWRLFPKEERLKRNCYQGLIRLAIAYNHYICGRKESSLRVLRMAYQQLKECGKVLDCVDLKVLLKKVELNIYTLEREGEIKDFPGLNV